MPIDVEWQNERGQCSVRYAGPLVDGRLPGRASPDSQCLRFIDEYGNTTFNTLQMPVLEQELSEVAGRGDDEITQQARCLLEFIRSQKDRIHHYPKFIGD